ncbi:hypothetical protein D3C76_1407950 [compost metagenome]
MAAFPTYARYITLLGSIPFNCNIVRTMVVLPEPAGPDISKVCLYGSRIQSPAKEMTSFC